MGLVEFVAQLLAGVFGLLVVATLTLIDREEVISAIRTFPQRVREIAPHLGLLVLVLLVNRLFRHLGQEVSWVVGWKITGLIYLIEGRFVATLQSAATPVLTQYFSFMYLYGYVFLTLFPFLAYWVLEDPRPIREAIVAFAVNYGLGLVCYTLFISYGPRNLIPDLVTPLLYTNYPQSQLLTSTVNANTNVFPSLHTSLSATVVLLAWRTRDTYPVWFYLSVPVATSVVVATMYLGIHWAIDVVAGLALALVAVWVGDRFHDISLSRDVVARVPG